MVASDPQHGPVMANPEEPVGNGANKFQEARTHHVEGGHQTGGICSKCSSTHAGKGNVGILGKDASSSHAAIHPEEIPRDWGMRMKQVDVVRLLNSTPLGKVVNERQLYRHRHRAMNCFYIRRRVNLLTYIAWLAHERHRCGQQPRPGQITGPISFQKALWLLEQQDYRCALTGRKLAPDTVALDHILAISRGGKHVVENGQILHKDVNRAKYTLTNDEFVELCREVVNWTDSRKEKRDHGD